MAKFTKFTLACLVLGTLSAPVTAAHAAIDDVAPTTETTWNEGQVEKIEFDPFGRLWVWNNPYSPSLPYGPQTNVLVRDESGNWDQSFRFKPRKFGNVLDIHFADDGTMYATSFNSKLAVVTFKPSGAVKKVTQFKFLDRESPDSVTPIDGNKLSFVRYNKLTEYAMPFTARSKPIRTMKTTTHSSWGNQTLVAPDGTLYYSYTDYATNEAAEVDVYLPGQEGSSSPDHSFTVDPGYAGYYIGGMTFTPDGELALRINQRVVLFPSDASGSNLVPASGYSFAGSHVGYWSDVAFDSTGIMALADFNATNSLRFFFETR
jgi:hypothetical protein